jgi:hypothetical protein
MESFIQQRVRDNPRALYGDEAWFEVLRGFRHRWSLELSLAVITGVHLHSKGAKSGDWILKGRVHDTLRISSWRVSFQVLDHAAHLLEEIAAAGDLYREVVNQFVSTVQFRRDMHKELAE